MSVVEPTTAVDDEKALAAVDALGDGPRVVFGAIATTVRPICDSWEIRGDGFFLMVQGEVKVLSDGSLSIGPHVYVSPTAST